jgi:hypothetical protein
MSTKYQITKLYNAIEYSNIKHVYKLSWMQSLTFWKNGNFNIKTDNSYNYESYSYLNLYKSCQPPLKKWFPFTLTFSSIFDNLI